MENIELRDFFAASALAGLLAHGAPKLANADQWLAESSYRYADALLKVREGE
jgi:hypothetical protein